MKHEVFTRQIRFNGFASQTLTGEISTPLGKQPDAGLLFCHGIFSNRRDFGSLPFDLGQLGICCLTFDFSGHGESQGKPFTCTAQSHIADTQSALNELTKVCPAPIVALGHSFGATAALAISLAEEVLQGTILVGPRTRSGNGLSPVFRMFFRTVGLFLSHFPHLPDFRLPFPRTKPISSHFLGYAATADNVRLGRKSLKPCLIISGKQDNDVPPEESAALFRNIASKEKRYLLLEHSGHCPFNGPDHAHLLKEVADFTKGV